MNNTIMTNGENKAKTSLALLLSLPLSLGSGLRRHWSQQAKQKWRQHTSIQWETGWGGRRHVFPGCSGASKEERGSIDIYNRHVWIIYIQYQKLVLIMCIWLKLSCVIRCSNFHLSLLRHFWGLEILQTSFCLWFFWLISFVLYFVLFC